MIAGVILIVTIVILVILMTRKRETYIVLGEVIPHARVVSHEDGIIEYDDIYFILGTHDLYMRKYRVEKLLSEGLVGPCIVDLKFDTQVIIKKGPVPNVSGPGPVELQ